MKLKEFLGIILFSLLMFSAFIIGEARQYIVDTKEMNEKYDDYIRVMNIAKEAIQEQHERIDSLYDVIDSLSIKR